MPEPQKRWIEPELVALTRDAVNQESLLATCKNTRVKAGGSPEMVNSGCFQSNEVGCMSCSILTNY